MKEYSPRFSGWRKYLDFRYSLNLGVTLFLIELKPKNCRHVSQHYTKLLFHFANQLDRIYFSVATKKTEGFHFSIEKIGQNMDENILFGYIAISKECLTEDQVRQGISELQKNPGSDLSLICTQKKWLKLEEIREINDEVKGILASQEKEKFVTPVQNLKVKVTQQINSQSPRKDTQKILEKVALVQDEPTEAISRNAFMEKLAENNSGNISPDILQKVEKMQNQDTQRVNASEVVIMPDSSSNAPLDLDDSDEIVVRRPTQFMRNMSSQDLSFDFEQKAGGKPKLDGANQEILKKVEMVQDKPTQIIDKNTLDKVKESPLDISSNLFSTNAKKNFLSMNKDEPKPGQIPKTQIMEMQSKKKQDTKKHNSKIPERYLLSFDNYKILNEIARGGMGIVYKATQINPERIVAIKVMKRFDATNPKYVARFQREIESARKLNHPNIVAIYDAGEIDGTPYFTMEYVEGVTLSQYAKQKKVSIVEAVKIMKKIAVAIDHAHKHHIIHRDLKPANIIMDKNGEPHITDFGLAKDISHAIDLTQSGIILGTPYYMSPEQSLANRDQIGAASDIFSMGVILYELLTERLPFVAEDVSRLYRKIAFDRPQKTRKINKRVAPNLEIIVEKALAKKPYRRYSTAVKFAEDLERYLNNDPIEAKPASMWQIFLEEVEKHQLVILCCIFVSLLLSAFYFLVVYDS